MTDQETSRKRAAFRECLACSHYLKVGRVPKCLKLSIDLDVVFREGQSRLEMCGGPYAKF